MHSKHERGETVREDKTMSRAEEEMEEEEEKYSWGNTKHKEE